MTYCLAHPYWCTAIVCFFTGYIPTVSTEVFLVGIGLLLPAKQLPLLAFIGALSQTLAKLHLYFIAAKIIPYLTYKTKRRLVRLRHKYFLRHHLSQSIIFISSLVGLPPYYLLNLLCGILNTGWLNFALLGLSGMFMRFLLCLYFPQFFLIYSH